jgi:hypothetical protein
MESRHARHWRAFVHELLYPDGNATLVYDGACFLGSSGAVEYAEGCFLPSPGSSSDLARDLAQFPRLFEQLARRAVLAERDQYVDRTVVTADEASPAPALCVGAQSFRVVRATLSSTCAVTKGCARGLVAEKLPFGVLVVAFQLPLTLERVFQRVDRACNALRR